MFEYKEIQFCYKNKKYLQIILYKNMTQQKIKTYANYP